MKFPNYKPAILILRALNHDLRSKILDYIHEHESCNVTELCIDLRFEQSVISAHLAILSKAGVVEYTKDGREHWYHINYDRLEKIGRIVKELANGGQSEES